MSSNTILSTAPVADPDFPVIASTGNSPFAANPDPFTMDEVDYMESVLWYWEEYSPYSRDQDTTGRIPDIRLEMLTSIRSKLAGMKPATT